MPASNSLVVENPTRHHGAVRGCATGRLGEGRMTGEPS